MRNERSPAVEVLPPFTAVVVAAGAGVRLAGTPLGGAVPKPFRDVAGRPLFSYSLEILARQEGIRLAVLVVARDRRDGFEARWDRFLRLPCPVRIVVGGARRVDSVRAGLAEVPADVPYVAVHDAARPGLGGDLVARLRSAAARDGAAVPVLPVADTLKEVRSGRVVRTVPREGIHSVGTPQVFAAGLLREALDAWPTDGVAPTDCAQAVERLGRPVAAVEGDPAAFKITLEEDLRRFSGRFLK
ncbi:MAG: 2-C-methyl-D-erythritol 4-phosphate cytidylyltransferase [Planctomycetes bacterium]|nr:2-C-methyl-D-erythritol 4-phosphate cytidylyltransferase [Planctomycetota bacterium]